MDLMKELSKRAGGPGGIAELIAQNPHLVAAALSLLSKRDTSVGGNGGLEDLIAGFQRGGLGDVMASWIGTGKNQPIGADSLSNVLGKDTLSEFAGKAGISFADAGPALAAILPGLVDHFTPEGKVPKNDSLESALGGLLANLGR